MEFYYQIKGKKGKKKKEEDYTGWGESNWSFPPIFSGKVTANDKKEARSIIDQEYGKKFPMRVPKKDLSSNEFLLNIEEIKEGSRTHKLFDKQECDCGKTFYVIDKYNDVNVRDKGDKYCSDVCAGKYKEIAYHLRRNQQTEYNIINGKSLPVIYKITNKNTSLCYIGQTTQVFTLRWYQHFFFNSGCKFHDAIKTSEVTDWVFEVIEVVSVDKEALMDSSLKKIVDKREMHWIRHYNSATNGYNTMGAGCSTDPSQVKLDLEQGISPS